MKFKKVEISNFRSIEHLEIDFKENPRILVGLNEGGKTNILHALRLLSSDFSPQKNDVRQPFRGIVEKSYILFTFEFNEQEKKEIYNKVKNNILMDDFSEKIIKIKNKEFNLLDICNIQKEVFYKVDVKENNKKVICGDFYNIGDFIFDFKKPKINTQFSFQNKDGNPIDITNFKLINYEKYKNNIPPEYLENAEIKDLEELILSKIS